MNLDPKPPPPAYARLFGIDLKHRYYANGLCSDFAVVATDDTARLLRNHRCVVKPKANGIEIFVETDTDHKPKIKPKIAFSPNVTLSFELHLNNPEFELFTDPAPLKGESDWQITYTKQSGRYFGKLDINRDFNKVEGNSIEFFFSAKKAFWVYYYCQHLHTFYKNLHQNNYCLLFHHYKSKYDHRYNHYLHPLREN